MVKFKVLFSTQVSWFEFSGSADRRIFPCVPLSGLQRALCGAIRVTLPFLCLEGGGAISPLPILYSAKFLFGWVLGSLDWRDQSSHLWDKSALVERVNPQIKTFCQTLFHELRIQKSHFCVILWTWSYSCSGRIMKTDSPPLTVL